MVPKIVQDLGKLLLEIRVRFAERVKLATRILSPIFSPYNRQLAASRWSDSEDIRKGFASSSSCCLLLPPACGRSQQNRLPAAFTFRTPSASSIPAKMALLLLYDEKDKRKLTKI